MQFFKARTSKKSDYFVLFCGLFSIIIVLVHLIVGVGPFDITIALTEIFLVLLYFLTSKEKIEKKYMELGLDKPIFFMIVLLIALILLMIILSAVI